MSDNRRIALNTLSLYFRMILTMMVSLYTSRIVLEVLGVEDFGIYNVVGGIVVMFGFLNSAMSTSTQRFLSFEVGRGNLLQLQKVFSSSVIIHAIIAISIFLIAESVGLWFLNTQLSIPDERMSAANWVYQFSIFAFMVNVMTVPFNALIISHEKMEIYAYISILEVVLKLLIVYLLSFGGFDKLKLYACLIFCVSLLISSIYQFYCLTKFPKCRFKFTWQNDILKKLTSFSGWNLFGGVAYIAKNQGVNIVLNVFFGTAINAAWGIAQQVNTAVLLFVQNFVTAINPPIIKAYAKGDRVRLFSLLFSGMKYTFFLAFCLIIPLLFDTDFVLSLWLKTVPDNAVVMVKFILIAILIELFSHVVATTVLATGNVKWYQIVVGIIVFLNLPFSYAAIEITHSPIAPMYVMVFFSIVSMICRFLILYRLVHFPLLRLFSLFRLTFILMICTIPIIFLLLQNLEMGFLRFILIFFSNIILSTLVLFAFGMTKDERSKIRLLIANAYRKYKQ